MQTYIFTGGKRDGAQQQWPTNCVLVFCFHPISSFHLFINPLSLGLITTTLSTSPYGKTLFQVMSCLQYQFIQVMMDLTLTLREGLLHYVAARWCRMLNQSRSLCKFNFSPSEQASTGSMIVYNGQKIFFIAQPANSTVG